MKFSWRNRSIAVSLCFFLIGALSAYAFFYFRNPAANEAAANIHTLRLGQHGLINPLLEYVSGGSSDHNGFRELEGVKNSLQSKVDENVRNGSAKLIGVYFRDLQSGHWTGVNELEKFSPASLLKVPLMMAYFKLAETKPEILNQQILYDGSFDDNAKEDIKPLKSIQPGNSYTADDLIRFMIQYSDNNATALLFNRIDNSLVNKVYTDISVQSPTSTDDFLSPKSYSLFFRMLYNATYLSEALSQKALELLSYNDFSQGIQAGIPENVTAAEKFGEHEFPGGTKELHDCGIVYHAPKPYVLCVMTKGTDFIKLGNAIRDISALVYGEVDKNYR